MKSLEVVAFNIRMILDAISSALVGTENVVGAFARVNQTISMAIKTRI